MASMVFVECGCPPGPAHKVAQNVGYVFYCADCRGFLSLRNATLEDLIDILTKLRDAEPVDLGPLR
jgi:hypothetical protein